MMKFTKTLGTLLIAALTFSANAELTEKKETTEGQTEVALTADVTFTVIGNDTMQFDNKAIEVTEGQVVKLIFKNAGSLPKEAMGHNLAILKPGTDGAAFAMAGISNPGVYLPTDEANKAKIVASTKILGPGEEEAITFTAGEPGEYPYLCTFPGHFGVMNGILTVKAK